MSDATPRKAAALERLRARTPGSAAMRPRAERRLALEAVPTFAMPVPLYIESGDGAYMTDVDGNAYLDLAMGFGSLILATVRPRLWPRCTARSTRAGIRSCRA